MRPSDKLYELLLTEIKQHHFRSGDRFYSERELSARHDVARLTARRVIQRLVSHGYLRQEPGRGTFLAPRDQNRPKTNSILLVTEPLDPQRSLIDLYAVALLQTMAAKSGYHIVLASSRYQQLMEKRRADGVILHSVHPKVHEWFSRRGDPLIVIGSTADQLAVPRVRCRDEAYFHGAVALLAESGHRCVAFLAKRPTTVGSRLRAGSLEQAVKTRGLDNAGCCYFASPGEEEPACRRMVRRLIQSPHPPTAIVTARITQAAHVLAELSSQGVAVPDDISILSGGDAGIAHLLNPKVTTVDEPVVEMFDCAWEMLLEQCEMGRAPRVRERVFESSLTMRDSVAKRELRSSHPQTACDTISGTRPRPRNRRTV
jgi:DNA-binding LacI/PurR family transcriptional regulator